MRASQLHPHASDPVFTLVQPAKEYDTIEKRFGSVLNVANIEHTTVILLADRQEETVADAIVR